MTPVFLATEDPVSEAVGLQLLAEHHVLVTSPPHTLRQEGNGYLFSRIENFRALARRHIVLVLTDLDTKPSPAALLADWLGAAHQAPQNLLLQVAVREVESWLLADHHAMEKLFRKPGRFPAAPDDLPDPKQHLLTLARKAPREIRDDLIAQKGAIAKQGPGYNRRLIAWLEAEWSPQRAAERSPSLAHARTAIRTTAERVTNQPNSRG